MRIGIDTGGTFTDFVCLEKGEGRVYKAPSTPQAPLGAIAAGLKELCSQGLEGVEVVHGTTVGTNAFLERRGARVALLTTQGFEEVLFIGRQTRRELFNLQVEKAREIIPRDMVLGVAQRQGSHGRVEQPLTSEEISRVRGWVKEKNPEALAICLLHSYANPEHEERLAAALSDLGAPVSLSSRVLPEFREYERTCATVINAYLGPILARYLKDWSRRFPGVPLFIQQSNGGFLPGDRAGALALHTVLSGPAGGVYGAMRLARDLGEPNLLTLDMGGTSTDVALVAGEIPFTGEYMLEDYPLGIPVIDIHTVGAGGGSIAFRDRSAALRVGPRSAGADPGPVCYGRGGELTVTDAQLFLGRLRPESFLGGRMTLDQEAVRRALGRLAGELGVAPEDLASGIIRVANSHMGKALQAVSLERGLDPRDFTLFCFGGAGGLHVCELAQDLEISRILIPAQAGVLSALGMALAGFRRDFSRTLLLSGYRLTWENLEQERHRLEKQGMEELESQGQDLAALAVAGELEMRYRGQTYTLKVPFTPSFLEDFHERHRRVYGHVFPERPAEAVVLRLFFQGAEASGNLPPLKPAAAARVRLPRAGEVWLPQGPATVPFYYRPELLRGSPLKGPALVLDDYATLLVLPGFQGEVLEQGHLLLTR
ncbi:MAG: hydantoinase/oxoprolinase family protein [Deltaproteobacteria bacterium]|nr:hydantoinase/oxoprolinase family protein [Deltaproteobacteria bacterium]